MSITEATEATLWSEEPREFKLLALCEYTIISFWEITLSKMIRFWVILNIQIQSQNLQPLYKIKSMYIQDDHR